MTTERRKPLRWRKEPDEKGLARVGQRMRGVELRLGDETVARVYPWRKGGLWSHEYNGWYWVARSDVYGIPLVNTSQQPVKNLDEAKAAAKAYVLGHMKP